MEDALDAAVGFAKRTGRRVLNALAGNREAQVPSIRSPRRATAETIIVPALRLSTDATIDDCIRQTLTYLTTNPTPR